MEYTKLAAHLPDLVKLAKHLDFYGDVLDDLYDLDIRSKVARHIKAIELSNEWGINFMNLCYGLDHMEFSYNSHFTYYGDGTNRTISWPDDGVQPSNEWLYRVSYANGAYIFGDHYDTKTFNEMFEHLKTFKPKYLDSKNSCLYFTAETAKIVHDSLQDIHGRYNKISKERSKDAEIKKLEAQLGLLKSQ